jgi:RNA polymerase sigma-70 factor (ECF subfamily)
MNLPRTVPTEGLKDLPEAEALQVRERMCSHRLKVEKSAAPSAISNLERSLITAAAAGDAGACREIFDRYRPHVFSLAAYTLDDPAQAEDIVQTVFMKVFRVLRSFRFESSLGTWIYRITMNECHDHRRTRLRRVLSLEDIRESADEADSGPAAEEFQQRRESVAHLQQAMLQLSQKLRTVIVLRYIEGLSYEEIAGVTGCSGGTVASRISRALCELESHLHHVREKMT